MSFGNALLYSLVGILTVFFALILLMCIIKIMTAAGDQAEQNAAAKVEAKTGKTAGRAGTADSAAAGSGAALATGKAGAGAVGAASVAGQSGAASSGAASQTGTAGAVGAAPAGPLAPGSAGEVKLYDTPPAVAAMLMAIVADELKTPLNELRFISIREIREEES